MRKRFRQVALQSSELRALLAVGFLLMRRISLRLSALLHMLDLYLFPPLVFASNFYAVDTLFPAHPVRLIGVLASAFMSTTLTLFVLRPPKPRYPGHWVGL